MATTRVQIGQRIFNYPFTDSLLTSVAYMNPRYDGSKLVSSQKNIYTDGDVSYGKEANIIEKTNTIYEFDWGGGAYPEVENGGAVHLNKIISLEEYDGDNSDVYLTRPSDNEYNQWDLNLKRTLYVGDEINLEQYTNNVDVLPNRNLVSIEPGDGVPVYSNGYGEVSGSFLFPTQSVDVYGNYTPILDNEGLIFLVPTGTVYPILEIDSNGDYTLGTLVNRSTIISTINDELAKGETYYVSFYENVPSTISDQTLNQIGKPSKIKRIIINGALNLIATYGVNNNITPGTNIGNGGIGLMIWKARKGDFVTIQPSGDIDNSSYSGLKNGAFYRNFSTDSVKTHFKEITQIFGERPST